MNHAKSYHESCCWVPAARCQAELGPITFKTLADFGIPYDEIYFGKPDADVYIDDKSATSVWGNLRKQIGWYDGMVRGLLTNTRTPLLLPSTCTPRC